MTLVRLFEELRGLGYEGGYDAVRRYAKAWAKKRGAAAAEACIPLSFSAGEPYQFDWSHEIVLINGVTSTVKVAHFRLCRSRMPFVRATISVRGVPGSLTCQGNSDALIDTLKERGIARHPLESQSPRGAQNRFRPLP